MAVVGGAGILRRAPTAAMRAIISTETGRSAAVGVMDLCGLVFVVSMLCTVIVLVPTTVWPIVAGVVVWVMGAIMLRRNGA